MNVFKQNNKLSGIIKIICIVHLIMIPQVLTAQSSLQFSILPTYSLPLAESTDVYSYGLGAAIEGAVPFGSGLIKGIGQFSYSSLLLNSNVGNLHLLELGFGAKIVPIHSKKFSLSAFALGGVYAGFYEQEDPLANPYFKAGVDAEFKFTDAFSMAAIPAYKQLFAMRDGEIATFYSSFDVSLKLSLQPANLGSGLRKSKIKILDPSFKQIFPVIYKYYNNSPIGSFSFINNENKTIYDVVVEFYVPQYMDAPQIIAELPEIRKNAEIEVPITALFKNDVLDITEKDSAQAQIIISYSMNNQTMKANRNSSLSIYDRNSITWDDDRKAAAFVTAKDPTILKFSRNMTSEVSDENLSVVNENLSNAVVLFEALNKYGIRYTVDPDSSYQELSATDSATDFLQFPIQTLDYKSGDCDDLSILYAALLESVSVKSAFITIPGHIYLAFALDITRQEALKKFATLNQFIFTEDNTWVPVEVTMLSDGFYKAWETGARQWNTANDQGNAQMYPVREAWGQYEPSWISNTENNGVIENFPRTAQVSDQYQSTMGQFIQAQLDPQVKILKERIAENPIPRLKNWLGSLYAKYGKYDEAISYFNDAAKSKFLPALLNLGNLAYLREDYREASRKFHEAYRQNPNRTEVILSLAMAKYELKEYAEATNLYKTAEVLDPEGSARFSYIAGGSDSLTRAAETDPRKRIVWFDE